MSEIIRSLSRNAIPRTTLLPPEQEAAFQEWYASHAKPTGLSANADDPEHHYDWRAAYKAGATPAPDEDGSYHWPSEFKKPDHPNRYVDGMDTRTGRRAPIRGDFPERKIR